MIHRRLLQDIRQIYTAPLNSHGIHYIHHETNAFIGHAMIIGQKHTPYYGGYFFFKFEFPSNYPYSPPTVTAITNIANQFRFNPNIYTNGKVCVSVLNTWKGEQWSACQTLSSILLIINSLFNENPLYNEPGIHMPEHSIIYNKMIHNYNIQNIIAHLHLSTNNIFYTIIREEFNKNCNDILLALQEEQVVAQEQLYLPIFNYVIIMDNKQLLSAFNNAITIYQNTNYLRV